MVEMAITMHGVVCNTFITDQTEPLQIRTGEKLKIGERKSKPKGWIWCINRKGLGGWVPEIYLVKNNDGVFAWYDYSARELIIKIGEILILGRKESGWAWCTNTSGQSGWVPQKCIHNL